MENLKDENSLGEKLKFYRCRDGMTQEYVAKKIGVSRQAVSKWETDAVEPSTANIIALSNLFDISSDQLLKKGVTTKEQKPRKNIKKRYLVIITALTCIVAFFGTVLIQNLTYYTNLISPTNNQLKSFVEKNSEIDFVDSPKRYEIDESDKFWNTSHILTFNLGYYYDENINFEGVLKNGEDKFRIVGIKFESTEQAAEAFNSMVMWENVILHKFPWLSSKSKYAEYYWDDLYVFTWYDKNEYVICLAESRESGILMKKRLAKHLMSK